MNKPLNSVALISLYSSWFKLHSSILYSSWPKAIFERTKVLKFCWIIYTKVFSRILLNSVAVSFYSKTSFLIVNALLPFRVNILRHRPLPKIEFFMTKYGNMLESNQSPKLLVYLLLCQSCRYECYSRIDYYCFAIFCFLYITFYFGDFCIVAK